MIVKLYTIYDRLAEEAGPVFQSKNDETAKRSAVNTFLDSGMDVQTVEQNYRVIRMAEYDTEKAIIHAEKPADVDYYSVLVTEAIRRENASQDKNKGDLFEFAKEHGIPYHREEDIGRFVNKESVLDDIDRVREEVKNGK